MRKLFIISVNLLYYAALLAFNAFLVLLEPNPIGLYGYVISLVGLLALTKLEDDSLPAFTFLINESAFENHTSFGV